MKRLWGAVLVIGCLGLLHAPAAHAGEITFTDFTATPQDAQLGDPVRLDAYVTAPFGGGGVEFIDTSAPGQPILAAVAVENNGHAVASVSTMSLGSHDIRAHYTGTNQNDPSDSDLVTVTVGRIITAITATPVLAKVSTLTLYLGALNANLHRADSGAPIANKTVSFFAGAQKLCTVKTAANGTATCAGQLVPALLSLGYRVVFDGDAADAPATGSGGLIN